MHPDERHRDRAPDGGAGFRVERGPDESTTQAILRGIAAMRGVAETDIEPVYEQVNFEALEALLRHADERGNSISVQFEAAGCVVCVQENGGIRIVDDGSGSTNDGSKSTNDGSESANDGAN